MTENAPPSFSTPQASTKSKRHSLNVISPGPRPLQLASGSVLSSPSNLSSRSQALQDFDSPPSAFGARSVKNSRRQSSISYLPSKRDQNRPTSLSPLSPTVFSRGLALRNGNSAAVEGAGEMGQGSKLAIDATGTITLDTLKQLKGRPPATLAEKHAELLHFIAQKESKCLELRSQLATHEAELLQLKRQWERIINRGFEKSSSSSFVSASIPSTASSLTTSAAPSSSGVVLEGIKEGVQEMGRFFTAGLGSIAQGNSPVSSSTLPTSRGNRRVSSKFPVPLRLDSGDCYGHESQSSSSTSISATTVASSSTLATSLMSEHGTASIVSPPFTSASDEASNEYDEFGDFEEAPTRNLNDLAEQEENTEQVLMVHDTGATPMMSPNPHFRRRNRMDVEQNGWTGELDSGWNDRRTTFGGLMRVGDDSIDDFMNPGSQAEMSSSSTVFHTVQPFPTTPPMVKTPSLPGVSSIPGLASSSIPMNSNTSQSMSAWVGSVGKKWGEIRESQTFTKSQKRASILLSDVSQSIVSALISPSTLSTPSRSAATSKPPLENSLTTNAFHIAPHLIKTESTITTNKNELPIPTSLLDDLDVGEVDEALKLGIGLPVLVPDQASKKNALDPSTKLQVKVGLDTMNNVPRVLPSSNSIDDEDWNW